MDINFHSETALQLLFSFIIGTVIGIEREYRSKAAGLRTMIVICLGSTIFTEISLNMGPDSPDRIAANIITGIGFLGAGVIFKDGLTVSGITTATTIWIVSALGMAVGAGEYFKLWIIRMHQSRTYKITLREGEKFIPELRKEIDKLRLECRQERDMKDEALSILVYEISGREKYLDDLNSYLKNDARVKSYE